MKGNALFIAASVGLFVALAPSAARAERVRPFQLELDLHLQGNRDVFITEGRLFGGWCFSADDVVDARAGGDGKKGRAWLPFFGVGASMSAGKASVDDPRGLDGTASMGRYSIGGELRVGFAGRAGTMHHYAYLAATPMYVVADKPYGDLPEYGGAFGVRSALGLGWPGKWTAMFSSDDDERICKGGQDCGLTILLLFLVPNHVEFTYENVAGTSHRFGGAIGYTF